MPVLLGVKDAPIPKTAQTFPTLNKIGGEPDHFLTPDAVPQCPQCEKRLYLVVQLYCPLDQSPYHRTLYIYACVNRPCWGKSSSWKVLREQNLDESSITATSKPVAIDCQKDIWGDGDDDWGDEEDKEEDNKSSFNDKKMADVEELTTMIGGNFNFNATEEESSSSSSIAGEEVFPVQQATELVSQSDDVYMEETSALSEESLSRMLKLMASTQNTSNEQPIIVNKSQLNSYYLNVFEDSESDASSTQHIRSLFENYSQKEGKTFQNMLTSVKSGQEITGSTEDYEKDDIKYNDESFYKFHKALSCWPEQCIRYELGGKALPLSSEKLKVGVCAHCGSECQFELQLMPALISALTFPGSQDYAVEFGTLIVFTCKRNCWDKDTSKPRTEQCLVQCEKEQFLLQ